MSRISVSFVMIVIRVEVGCTKLCNNRTRLVKSDFSKNATYCLACSPRQGAGKEIHMGKKLKQSDVCFLFHFAST